MEKDRQKEGKGVKPCSCSGTIENYRSGYEGEDRDFFYSAYRQGNSIKEEKGGGNKEDKEWGLKRGEGEATGENNEKWQGC
jgi:hypothetical protein